MSKLLPRWSSEDDKDTVMQCLCCCHRIAGLPCVGVNPRDNDVNFGGAAVGLTFACATDSGPSWEQSRDNST